MKFSNNKSILEELSLNSISATIEDNIYNFFIKIGKKAKRIVHIESNIKWIITLPSIWPNYLFDARFEITDIEENLRDIIRQIKRGDAPAQWFIGPRSNSSDFIKILSKYGFNMVGQWPGMAIELLKMNTDFSNPPNLSIEVIKKEDSLSQWVSVVSTAMFGNGFMGIDLFKNLLTDTDFNFYLAFLNEKPVATSLAFISSGIVGLYLISTLPEYRNRGIGKMITLAPLYDAKKIGYKIGGLFATQLGERIYRRIGFKEVCNFDIYFYGYF